MIVSSDIRWMLSNCRYLLRVLEWVTVHKTTSCTFASGRIFVAFYGRCQDPEYCTGPCILSPDRAPGMATQRLIHSKPRKLKLERSWDLLSYSDYGTTRLHIKTLFPEPRYRHTIYNSHVLVQKSSSLKVLACLCDLGR